ncbi:hypothetical protein ACOMHN_055039 [Nucella lapillus]
MASRPASSGYGRPPTSTTTSSKNNGRSNSAAQQGDAARPQRVSSANRAGSSAYFDIANTILGSAADLDDLLLNAARDGDYNKVEQLLVKRGDIIVDIDCKDKRTGNTALIWAAKKGHNKMVQLLLRHGADPTLRNYNAKTAVEEATGPTLTVLLDSVTKATESSHRLLLQAAWQGDVEVIRRLLSNKVLDINCQNAEGLTPLMLVARDVQLFERLSRDLNTPYNPVNVAKELMKVRANVHARDNDGKSCLHYASQSMATVADRLVHAFLTGGSEPDQLDRRQFMPIHLASQHGNTNVVMALLDGGSEVNCRGFVGLTPLHISAHNDNQCTAIALLEQGADVTLTDDRGYTPVDLAKTRKLKNILKEAWTEATQHNASPELAPVRVTPSREGGPRSSTREESPGGRRGEVIFDGMASNLHGAQRAGHAARSGTGRPVLGVTERSRRADRQLLHDLENGRYTPSLLHGREVTRPLGTVRNKPGPPVLPNISSRAISSQGPAGAQTSESPPSSRRFSSQGEEVRRSLEDGRNLLSQRSSAKRAALPMRGRLNKTSPVGDQGEEHTASGNGGNGSTGGRQTHRRTGSDPFATRITDVAATIENIISNRRGEAGKPDLHLLTATAAAQHMSPLRLPLERESTGVALNIPTTIPEASSPGSSTTTVTFDTDHTSAVHHSTVSTQMMALPPTCNRILPPTPTFLTQRSYTNLEGVLSRAAGKDDDSSSSKEPSPRSDDESAADDQFRIGLANPMELLRSRSLLKEEFILAESRPSDPFMMSSGSDPASSSSSVSTASSSPREGAATGLGRATYRRSDPSLLTLTLREKAKKGSGFRKSDPLVVRRVEKGAEGVAGVEKSFSEVDVSKDKPPPGRSSVSVLAKPSLDAAGKVARSQSLRLSQRPMQQQNNPSSSSSPAASSSNLKRSQSIGNVASEPAAKPAKDSAATLSAQVHDSGKGAPFSGKGRLVIMRDTFSEFDNVFVESGGKCAHPQPLHSSSPNTVQSSAKMSSDVKPESAYIKRSSERSRHSSCEDPVVETPRMSVSDVAISGVTPSDTCVAKNAPTPSSVSKQSSNTGISKPPVPNSPSVRNLGQSASQKTVVVPQPSRQASVTGKGSTNSDMKPNTSASPNSAHPSNSQAVKGFQTSKESGAGKKASSIQASLVSSSSPSSGSAGVKGVPSNSSKETAAPTSMNVKKGASSPFSSAMPPTTTTTSGNSSISKPIVSKTVPAVSSSTPAARSGAQTPAQKSASSTQAHTVRKSASTESLSTSRAGSSAASRQASGEAGRKQSGVSSSQKSLSSSARNVTSRLSGASRASSTSSLFNLKADGGSPSKSAGGENRRTSADSVAKSAAQRVTKTASPPSNTQSQSPQISVSKSVTPSTTPSSSPKPAAAISAATPNAVAKVMQTWTRTAPSSPQPGTSNTKSPASVSSPSAKHVTGLPSGFVSPSGALPGPAQCAKPSPSPPSAAAGGASAVLRNQKAFATKPSASTSRSSAVMKSSNCVPGEKVDTDSKVQSEEKADADGSAAQPGKGIEPLVKITFSGMNPKPNANISKYSDPNALVASGPVIVNPFENLSVQHTSRDKSPGDISALAEAGYVGGKADPTGKKKPPTSAKGKAGKVAKKGKDPKRPLSGSSRQASAGKRKASSKSKDPKTAEAEEARPKSGKRARSGKRRGRKMAERQADKEVALLREMSSKDNMALISGIGWHVATACANTSEVTAATEMHIDSSDSEDVSDVESIIDAETLMNKLDVNRPNMSLTSPRFREIKSQADQSDHVAAIPALTGDGFPPMNLDVTQKDFLSLQAKLQQAISITSRDGGGTEPFTPDLEGLNDDLHKQLLLGKLTPIPEMPSLTGPIGNVAEAIARFDRSLKDNQLSDMLEGTPGKDMNPASPHLPHTQSGPDGSRKDKSISKESSRKNTDTPNKNIPSSKPPRVEITKPSVSSRDSKNNPRRTQSLKEGSAGTKRERPRRERKFSESKKDEEEEINSAIDEILSATNTSMSSTLKSTSTLKSGSNTLTEGDRHVLRKLQSHAKESPFHASKNSAEDDNDDDSSTLCGEHSGGGGGDGSTSDTNPNLLKVMQLGQFDLGAKVKAMIDAGAEESKVKAMMEADQNVNQQEAQQIVKVMNSFRHMELHAGSSQNPREPLLQSESHRVARVGADRVPLVRPSSAGAARTRGRFHELKKSTAGGSAQQLADKNREPEEGGKRWGDVGAHGGYAAVVEALAGDVARDMLGDTAASETMCSRLSRHSSRSGSACTDNSQEEETIQWKKGNVLGKGAFGTVWCGLTNEGELIAVKQIELNTADRQKAEREYEKVQEEVELLKTLKHINIVGYLGTSLDDSTVSIFMQFVPGGSIASILARFGALDETVFRRYTRQILQGVEYLHDNDVIHRDIKGGNVMLMPNGIIKLIDFGCAKRLCINLSLSQSQILRSMKGTPYWMAPEVVNESGHGKKSDIWSIGCTIFEMATRKPPWADMNPMAAIFAIGSERPVPSLPDKFSPQAITFVNRCLTRNQQQRPSATELLTDIFMGEQPSKK